MDLKTILVPLDETKQCVFRIRLAASLARAHGSRLVGLISRRDGSDGSSTALADVFKAQLRSSSPRSFDIFKVDDASPDAALRFARESDLVVVGQADVDDAEGVRAGYLAERLTLHADRPVVIVPCGGGVPRVGKNLLIAWDGTRESAVALRELSPILTRASSVSLVSPRGESQAAGSGALLVSRTLAWMERCGIQASAVQHSDTASLADVLASCPAPDVDLVVLGGYGHTRLREMLLGGVIQQILVHMKVPVLLAH